MTTEKQDQYISELDGNLTPEQLDQLLMLAEGETGDKAPDDATPPVVAQEQEKGTASADSKDDAEEGRSADNTVILTRDGKHTIGYEKLVEARQGMQHWRAQAEAAQSQLAELQAQAQARANAGESPTKTDNQVAAAQAAIDMGVDPDIFGDFSEEALAKGIQQLVAQQVQAQVSKALEPIQSKQASDANTQHYRAIYDAHPDADSVAESKELADWIASQPSMARDAYANVLNNGTTAQVIELFSAFKSATTVPAQGQGVKDKAQSLIAGVKPQIPASLSDIPGGRGVGVGRDEVLSNMTGADLLEGMGDMTREQIDAFLNRL